MLQRNRVYSLIVGNESEGIEINNLRIRFDVTKSSDNRKNKNQASVDIYNLSEDKRKLLDQRYVTVQLKVGYSEDGSDNMRHLFTGQVVSLNSSRGSRWRSKREGTDIVTSLVIDEFFKEINGRKVSKSVPAGKKVKDVILTLLQDLPEVTRHEMNGQGIEREVADGYPLLGTPRRILDNLSRSYGIEWAIDQTVLYVMDKGGSYSDNTEGVPSLGIMSGLIGRPEFTTENIPHVKEEDSEPVQETEDGEVETPKRSKKAKGKKPKRAMLKAKILLDASLTAGSLIKLDYPELEGYYKINTVRHTGDYNGQEWYSELLLETQ